jgi:hypothetical protein
MLDIEKEEFACFAGSLLAGCGILLWFGMEVVLLAAAATMVTLGWLGFHWLKVRLQTYAKIGRWYW